MRVMTKKTTQASCCAYTQDHHNPHFTYLRLTLLSMTHTTIAAETISIQVAGIMMRIFKLDMDCLPCTETKTNHQSDMNNHYRYNMHSYDST